MVSCMATNSDYSEKDEALESLDAIASACRTVRDQPWPMWLYPINAVLLGGIALTALLESSMWAALIVLGLAVSLAVINYRAGLQIGTPFAVPTSVGFRAFTFLAGACVIAAVLLRQTAADPVIIALAAGATASYVIASVVHYRSTHK